LQFLVLEFGIDVICLSCYMWYVRLFC
jgi:hypothetical protein